MNLLQARVFRQVLKATGNPAEAAKIARNIAPYARPCPRQKRPSGSAAASAPQVSALPDLDRAVAALESEAVRRALSGVAVPVFHQGRECGSTVKHSDQLLMFLLKTLRPDRYGAGREAAPQEGRRAIVLDIDLSAANVDGGEDGEGDGPEGEGA